MKVTAGSVNRSVYVYFVDDDGGTAPGEPTTGLLFSNIETGGSASYMRQGAARVDITLKTLASASAAHDDGGFILVDDTNMPGLYRMDVPDAAFAAGVDFVIIDAVAAAANNSIMRPVAIDIDPINVWDEAMVETTGAPAITGTFRAGLEWMFALSRNKITQTATTTTLRNDADGADLATSTVSDDATTYTRGEWST